LVINGVTYSGVVGSSPFTPNPAPTSTTGYTLTSITDNHGCIRTSNFTQASATITVNPLPQGVLTGGDICEGGTGELTFMSSSGTGPFTLVIDGQSYTNIESGIPFTVIPNPTSTTSYTLTTITDDNGCSRTTGISGASATITVHGLPQGVLAGSSICLGSDGLLTFTASVGTGPYTLIVSGETYMGVMSGVAFSVTSAPVNTSNYELTSIIDTYGCERTTGIAGTTATINVNPAPAAVIVTGSGTDFCGSTLLEASGGSGGTIYWQGTTSNGTSTAIAATQRTVTASGTYYFRSYDGTTCWGPEGSATVTIESPPTSGVSTGDYVWGGSTDEDWTKHINWLRRTSSGYEIPVSLPSTSSNIFVRTYGGGNCPDHYPVLESVNVITFNSIDVQSGASISVAPGTGLTVNSQIQNNGTFTLLSDITGTATLITDFITGSGNFEARQYLFGAAGINNQPNNRLYYLSSPVSGGTSNTFAPLHDGLTTNPPFIVHKLWRHSEVDETNGSGYTQITSTTEPLNLMQGYVARLGEPTIVTFSGNSFNVDVVPQITLTRTGTTHPKRGFNLVGNPYPSYLDFNQIDTSYIHATIWYRTTNQANTSMVFDTYNGVTQVGTSLNGDPLTSLIPPMQGFWVKVKDGLTIADLWFGSWMRTHEGDYLLKSNNNNLIRLFINDTQNLNRDETIIVFNDDAAQGQDEWDSEKMSNDNTAIPEIWTKESNTDLVINTMPQLYNGLTIPLYVTIHQAGDHVISYNLDDFDQTTDVWMQDLLLGTMHDVRTGSYPFTSNAVSNNNRFILHFTNVITDVNPDILPVITIYGYEHTLHINTPIAGFIEVYDVLGRIIASQKASEGMNTVVVPARGVYVVRVSNPEEVKIQKVTLW
jgi:hypothetical protein